MTTAHAERGPEFRVVSTEAEDAESAKTLIRLARYHKVQPKSLARLLGDEFWRDIAHAVVESVPPIRAELLAIWPQFQAGRLGSDGARMKAALLEAEPLVEAEPDEPTPPVEERFEVLDLMSFLDADYNTTYLIDGVLVKGQPCIMAAPKKALKTSTCADLAVSLATGTPFFGTFDVAEPQRVLFISAESGGSKLKASVRRVLASKGMVDREHIEDAIAGRLDIMLKIPRILDPGDMGWFAQRLRRFRPDVVIYDPFYRGLSGGGEVDHANLFSMGEALSRLNEVCEAEGVTLIIVHHFRKSIPPGDAPELDHIAYAGMSEWARQWILMARHTRYVPGSGMHELRVVMGGSEGHESDHVVRIDEGKPQEPGRKWEVTVSNFDGTDMKDAASTAQKTYERERGKQEGLSKAVEELAPKVLAYIAQNPKCTASKIRARFTISGDRAASVLARLQDQGSISRVDVVTRGGTHDGWVQVIPDDRPASWEFGGDE